MKTVPITIHDRIYGDIVITEPVIIELIQSATFQRLREINQHGTIYLLQHPQYDITRYEHSIGVWYLARRYGAPLDEQVAALLHDVSHTAFSHTVDYAYPGDKHEFADRRLTKFVLSGKIADILTRYGYDPAHAIDKSRYPMLNVDLPDISIDRLDYGLRDTQPDQLMPLELVHGILSHLHYTTGDGFYFDDMGYARVFSIMYMTLSRNVYMFPDGRGSFQVLADCMKYVIDAKLISEDDLFVTESELLNKLRSLHDTYVDETLARLHPHADFQYAPLGKRGEIHGANKIRIIDPLVKVAGKMERISSSSKVIRDMMQDFAQRYSEVDIDQIK